jgi:hypothetical protein
MKLSHTRQRQEHLRRPLLKSEILAAQSHTISAGEASRYLNVNYRTYRKYATLYGIFDSHNCISSKGVKRNRIYGGFGLASILAGEHPLYDRKKLKIRLVRAGILKEECALCGFKERRYFDNRCPLTLYSLDDDAHNLRRENLELRCLNCFYLTSGKLSASMERPEVTIYTDMENDDILTQMSAEEIAILQEELLADMDD